MKDGPDIARIAALIGDPARANMLTALMSGRALTASELAAEAGITAQTASSHLSRLSDGGLIRHRREGRHRYVTLASAEVAGVLEALMGLAAGSGHLRRRPGPRDEAMRKARTCYNHLAGEMGTRMFRTMLSRGDLERRGEDLALTETGHRFIAGFGITPDRLAAGRAPLCRECLDWSERRSHLAGRLGRAMLDRIEALGWAGRQPQSRVIRFTPEGERRFDKVFSG